MVLAVGHLVARSRVLVTIPRVGCGQQALTGRWQFGLACGRNRLCVFASIAGRFCAAWFKIRRKCVIGGKPTEGVVMACSVVEVC